MRDGRRGERRSCGPLEEEDQEGRGRDDERSGGVCAGGLGRFAADSSCFPTRLEKGGKERIGREEKAGPRTSTQREAGLKRGDPKQREREVPKKGWAGGAQK